MHFFDEKKLMIVSYYFPPTKTVGTIRIFNLHHEAQKHFKEVYALTTSNRKRFPKDDFDFDDSRTKKIPTIDLRRFLSKKNASPSLSQKSKRSWFSKFVSKLSYSFPFNLLLADGGLIYILRGYFLGKKMIRKEGIEYLFSSYKPYSDHLICFLLKKWNPKLFWVADFRDLHVDEIRKNVFFPNLQKWFNRKILRRADIVTTVSNGLEKKLTEFSNRTFVLRNGISSQSFDSVKTEPTFEKFTISYTGSIYPELQSADLLFQVIRKLIDERKIDEDKIQLIYAGKDGSVWEEWVANFSLKKINTTHGFLSLKDAQTIQKQSHVNVLLSWGNENQGGILTAKFYDYLKAQNPILLMMNGTRDEEFENIFKTLENGMIAYPNANDDLVFFIQKNYDAWKSTGEPFQKINPNVIAQFRWDVQMNQFLDFIHSEKIKKEQT